MKTEPAEALKEIKHCTWTAEDFNISDGLESHEVVDEDDAINIANIAFREGQSSPNIKQLEWTDHLRHYFANTPFGVYLILKNHNFEENESWTLYFSSYVIDECIDSDKAQEIAQADFERRVMKCLDL